MNNSKRSSQFLTEAPVLLISLVEARESFPGRDILNRLLTDARMKRPWNDLTKRLKKTEGWEEKKWVRFWKEVEYVYFKAQQWKGSTKTHTDVRNEVKSLMAATAKLQRLLLLSNRADHYVSEYFPQDLMVTNLQLKGIDPSTWVSGDPLSKSDTMMQILDIWPTMVETLTELSNSLKDETTVTGVIQRRKSDKVLARHFAVGLCGHFERLFKSPLFGTVAVFTTVATGCEIHKWYVQDAYSSIKTSAKAGSPKDRGGD